MFVTELGTAVPPDRYTQRDCYDALQVSRVFEAVQPRSRTLLRKVLRGANGIESRHLALNPLAEGLDVSPAAHSRRVEWKTAVSVLKPEHRDLLRFEQRGGLLRNVLTLEVPSLAAEAVAEILDQALTQASVSRGEIRGWMMHAGGRDLLNALRFKLGLAPEDLRWSSEVLREYGNMSSASVYFTLQRALVGGAPGGWWWLCSFGAGFSCHGALLQVE